MFDGPADQFHSLIASRTTEATSPSPSSIPLHLPLNFPHHSSAAPPSTTNTIATTIFHGFDLYPTSPQPPDHLDIQQPIPQFLHPLHHHQLCPTTPSPRTQDEEEEKVGEDELACIKSSPQGDMDRPWTDDEVIELFRTRSSIENWFPEATWEHVARKLEELGFKRTPEKCKEKFEEGSGRFYVGINNNDEESNFGKNNFRMLSELEEICQGDHSQNDEDEMEEHPGVEGGETAGIQASGENRDCMEGEGSRLKERTKRKRRRPKFEMFKRFCEGAVEKLMVQQEEMHNKLLERLARRDEEMIAKEEERKKQEMDRIKKELDERASEQAIAGDRQAAMIKLLKEFTSSILDDAILLSRGEPSEGTDLQTLPSIPSSTCTASISNHPANGKHRDHIRKTNDTENADASNTQSIIPRAAEDSADAAAELSNKRWPRDEVEALINLRCGMDNLRKQGQGGQREPPLWERVSAGMRGLGYKRSAKRCKEKWENVNKYFRKTKDVRKRRSADSRTCPYFRQLSNLYGGGGTAGDDRRWT